MGHKPIIIGCDNAGVDLKNMIKGVLDAEGIEYLDLGVPSASDTIAYPSVAEQVAQAIIDSNYAREGILICGTGIGMSITANKFPGVYAAVCHDSYSAERARSATTPTCCAWEHA